MGGVGNKEVFYVYVMGNPKGRFYVGQTSNLEARVSDHNVTSSSEGKYTRKNGPWRLLWHETHPSRASAMAREREIKKKKSAKWIREKLLGCTSVVERFPTSSGLTDWS